MEKMLTEITTELKALNCNIDLLEEGQNSLVGKTDALTAVVESLVSRFDSIASRLDNISTQVVHSTEGKLKLNQMENTLDLLETDVRILQQLLANKF